MSVADNPMLHAALLQLREYMTVMPHPHPENEGEKRAMIAAAFLSGAAIIMEAMEAGAGRPFVQKAQTYRDIGKAAGLMKNRGLLS